MEKTQDHWNHVYKSKQPDQVSWYAPHLSRSLDLIRTAAKDMSSSIIDVGTGESTLVDDLLASGYYNVSALDLSEVALASIKQRLKASQTVSWYVGDITAITLPEAEFDVWHDRAVFHFLTDVADRQAYVSQVLRAVKAGGHVIVATFGPSGPLSCSGLETVRYNADELHAQFGAKFHLANHATENHSTPWGTVQQFTYCYCRVAD